MVLGSEKGMNPRDLSSNLIPHSVSQEIGITVDRRLGEPGNWYNPTPNSNIIVFSVLFALMFVYFACVDSF